MASSVLVPVILSGGSGTRLWPMSRPDRPKQFLPLISDRSLLLETLDRLVDIPDRAPPIVVCNTEHRFLVAEEVRKSGLHPLSILLEPVGRNTAPAVALAALTVLRTLPHACLLVMPSDHAVRDPAAFRRAVETARSAAESGFLLTFGIQPDSPQTGYGYIECGESPASFSSSGVFRIARFVEKPDEPSARQFLESGRFLWNSGIFLFRADTVLSELETFRPDIVAVCRESLEGTDPGSDFCRPDPSRFPACPAISLDYAVMEKTEKAVVLPVDMGWSDVGSWGSLWEAHSRDSAGNAVRGSVYLDDVRDCLIYNLDDRDDRRKTLAAIGLSDLIIVKTADALLITRKDREQQVRRAAEALQNEKIENGQIGNGEGSKP